MGEGRAEALENTGDFIQLKQCYNYVSKKVEKYFHGRHIFRRFPTSIMKKRKKIFWWSSGT